MVTGRNSAAWPTAQPDDHFTVLINGQFSHRWDAGYQEFFITDDNRKVPALADQLSNMRCFNEEPRSAIGVPTCYNEALGSTCQVTRYDRLQSRPGGIPDKNVGIKSASEH